MLLRSTVHDCMQMYRQDLPSLSLFLQFCGFYSMWSCCQSQLTKSFSDSVVGFINYPSNSVSHRCLSPAVPSNLTVIAEIDFRFSSPDEFANFVVRSSVKLIVMCVMFSFPITEISMMSILRICLVFKCTTFAYYFPN